MEENKIKDHKDFQFIKNDEIDVIAISKLLWKKKNFIIKTIAVFFVIGFLVAMLSDKEYEATVTFIPQESGAEIGGSIGGLAAMAGINLDGVGAETGISPILYPNVISSLSFQKEIFAIPLTFSDHDKKISFSDYFLENQKSGVFDVVIRYTIGLPKLIIKKIKGKNKDILESEDPTILGITEDEYRLMNILSDRLVLDLNMDEGLIRLTGKMPEALAAAELTDKAQKLLQKYIINFKIQKSKSQLKFISERYEEKKEVFQKKQEELATFRDRNINVNSAFVKNTEDWLEAEYNLAYSIYSELAQQYESQQIKVKEDTPVFTIVDPVSIPYMRSEPIRFLILLGYTFLGIVISILAVLGKVFYAKIKHNWDEN